MLLINGDFSYALLEEIARTLSKKHIELELVNSEEIKELNLSLRGINESTDVLSFPLLQSKANPLLGSIVINIELAKSTAKELGHSLKEELGILFLHGLLHLLGFDHEKDQGQMRQKERELAKRFSLPNSLTDRVLENTA